MSMLLAAFMFMPLLAIAIAHFLWSIGIRWPIRNEKLLAQTVVGTSGVQTMPPRLMSLGIALLILAFGILALALADHDSGGLPLDFVGLLAAAVFLARGAVGYTPWWVAQTPEPSFRLNDRRVYSPLCLFVGIGFIILVVLRLL